MFQNLSLGVSTSSEDSSMESITIPTSQLMLSRPMAQPMPITTSSLAANTLPAGIRTTRLVSRQNDDSRREEQFRKLFIGGLSPTTDEVKLKNFFSEWGEIVDCVVMMDPRTGRSRGFGFVTYRSAEMVDLAQDARPHKLDGKEVETKRAMPRVDSDKPEAHLTVRKLFVGALKRDVNAEDLRNHFLGFGNVVESEIMTWKVTGQSRGFGFVTFDDYDPVDKAILCKPHLIKTSRADVKKALTKEEMAKVRNKQEQCVVPIGSIQTGIPPPPQSAPMMTSGMPPVWPYLQHGTISPGAAAGDGLTHFMPAALVNMQRNNQALCTAPPGATLRQPPNTGNGMPTHAPQMPVVTPVSLAPPPSL